MQIVWKGQDLDDRRGETVASRSLRRASTESMIDARVRKDKKKERK